MTNQHGLRLVVCETIRRKHTNNREVQRDYPSQECIQTILYTLSMHSPQATMVNPSGTVLLSFSNEGTNQNSSDRFGFDNICM